MTPAEIVAGIRLTNHGATQIACMPRTAAQRLALACSWDAHAADVDPAELARVIRRCPSIVAVPANLGPLPSGARVVQLHALRAGGYTDAGGIATIQIPARHLERKPTPRELARLIAGLLA